MWFRRLAVLFFVLAVLSGAEASDSEVVVSDLPLDFVIQRLKEVREGWEVVEIEFAHFEYRPLFARPGSERHSIAIGRFVLTASDCGELETFPLDEKGYKRTDKPEYRFVWTPDEFEMCFSDGYAEKFSRAELRNRKTGVRGSVGEETSGEKKIDAAAVEGRRDEKESGSWFAQFLATLFASDPAARKSLMPESPKDYLPLVFVDDATALADRFDLNVMENDKHYFLLARPKSFDDQRLFSETAICVDRETFIPVAKRTILPGGHYHSYVVMSLRVNGNDITPESQKTEQTP